MIEAVPCRFGEGLAGSRRSGRCERSFGRDLCLRFVDREYRGQGVATAARRGALKEIARLGGGLVESFPEDVTDRRTSAGFLHNATTSVFERLGFKREQPLGKRHWLMTEKVPASGDSRGRG
jgi:GNAT superfamily N-acetyltransferase